MPEYSERDIAIVGVAGRFAGASNIDQLHEVLVQGKDCVSELSEVRRKAMGLPAGGVYKSCGYLDQIDRFDHEFFGLSRSEAQNMAPQQRLLLEVAYETFESGGCKLSDLKGSDTLVFVGDTSLEYYKYAEQFDPTLVTGNTKEFIAAHISRFFGLHGATALMDTSCSSSLTAIHHARNELIAGNADQALICVANLELLPFKNPEKHIELDSPDGRSRSFSAAANGMSYGEIASCVLLKPLKKAMTDKDLIYGLIRGTAMNNSAARSASLTAPDSQAIADVIQKAWKVSKVNPNEIGFLEAHGSGTEIGDSIEMGGVNIAFEGTGRALHSLPVASIKTNIGHCRSGAGMAGLIKVLLSFKYQMIYPSLHFKEPNPLIDFDHSVAYVNLQNKRWEVENGRKRIAAVTSMGLSGTNCHVILEEPPKTEQYEGDFQSPQLFLFSAKKASVLNQNLQLFLDNDHVISQEALEDIAVTLATGKEVFDHRFAALANSFDQLREQVSNYLTEDKSLVSSAEANLILVFGLINGAHAEWSQLLSKQYQIFAGELAKCQALVRGDLTNKPDTVQAFCFQYAFLKLLESFGIPIQNVVGIGNGKLVTSVAMKKLTLEQAIIQAHKESSLPVDVTARTRSFIQRETSDKPAVFVEMGPKGFFADCYEKSSVGNQQSILISAIPEKLNDPILSIVKRLYESGIDIDWKAFFKQSKGRKISLPSYHFEKTRCWIREDTLTHLFDPQESLFHGISSKKVKQFADYRETERELIQEWRTILSIEKIDRVTGFFELGGDSLQATKLINRIRVRFGVDLDFEDIYDFDTVQLQADFIEEQMDTAQLIASYWKQVLKLDELKETDNFFELGGHSLNATQIINRIQEQLGATINFETLYENPTYGQLVTHVKGQLEQDHEKQLHDTIPQVAAKEYHPLSHSQERLWILCQLDGASYAYNNPLACEFKGELDPNALEQAFQTIIQRHDSLRTVFVNNDGVPWQHIQRHVHFSIELIILEPDDVSEQNLKAQIQQKITQPFNLEKGPLLRASLLKLAKDHYIFVLTLHHIISDGWSMNVLVREIFQMYLRTVTGHGEPPEPLKIQYKDYTYWLRERLQASNVVDDLAYWKSSFDGELPILNLPADHARPALKSYEGRIAKYVIHTELLRRLKHVSDSQSCSLFMLILAAFKGLIYRYTGQEDLIIGSPIAGRLHSDLENQIGFYANTIALRSQVKGQEPFSEYLQRVKAVALSAYQHQSYPFDKLIEELDLPRDMSRSPLFDVMFVLQNTEGMMNLASSAVTPDLQIHPFELELGASKFDLLLDAQEIDDRLHLSLQYNTGLFELPRIERMLQHLSTFLDKVASDVNLPLNQVNFLTEEEEVKLNSFNPIPEAYPAGETLYSLFEQQVRVNPDHIAVTYEGEQLTFEVLAEHADRVATVLKCKTAIKSGDVIGLLMRPSAFLPAVLMGILKCRAVYVPIDTECPLDRVNFQLANSEAKLLITDDEKDLNSFTWSGRLLSTVQLKVVGFENPIEEIAYEGKPEDQAYIIYTSGTTGRPKGVIIQHKAIVNRIFWMWSAYDFTEEDVLIQKTAYTFDVSVWEIFMGLCFGCRTVYCDRQTVRDPQALADLMTIEKVSTIHFVPSIYHLFLTGASKVWPELKRVICSGEALLPDLAKLHSEFCSLPLYNLYGPTEAAIDVTHQRVNPGDHKIPIGRPIQNISITIRDCHMHLVPVGVPGELCISGIGLAVGYVNDPVLTKEKFAIDSEGVRYYRTGDSAYWDDIGEIHYVGRLDEQVKLRGYRIELKEIESVLVHHQNIKLASVLIVKDPSGDSTLAGYFTSNKPIEITEVRSFLQSRIPEYMVPEYLINLEIMPLSENGKTDKKQLPLPWTLKQEQKANQLDPESDLEYQLLDIWGQVLGNRKIGIDDNFFDVGGNSMKIVKLFHLINKAFPGKLKVANLFSYPTIKKQALQLHNPLQIEQIERETLETVAF